MKNKRYVTITIPMPISKIVSKKNMIVTNEGEYYSPYETWFESWTEEMLASETEEQRFYSINQEFCGELENGFVFQDEEDAIRFIAAMRDITTYED